jgi:hypothetical protein
MSAPPNTRARTHEAREWREGKVVYSLALFQPILAMSDRSFSCCSFFWLFSNLMDFRTSVATRWLCSASFTF